MIDTHNTKLLLMGAGKMGGALLQAWLRAGIPPEKITVVKRTPPNEHLLKTAVAIFETLDDVKNKPDIIILAIKPQMMDAVLPQLKRKFGSTPLYLSIAAGKTLTYFANHLGTAPVIRAMPNTPALIGKAISVLCGNHLVSEAQKTLATHLLQYAGEAIWLENESQIDAVTAISGSGPAYIFLFMESLLKAGQAQGLSAALCKELVRHTVIGSALLAASTGEPFPALIKNVTSPGGTTEAALTILMKDNMLENLIANAVNAAIERAKELA